jgi:hypothetical protein
MLIDPNNRAYTFELYGLDFMIDQNYKAWLIEVNNNPCLETTCPLLSRIIPQVVENVVKVAIDPMYPPPCKVWNIVVVFWTLDLKVEVKVHELRQHTRSKQIRINI